ncbi:GNAT family N-acetyltransferase [Ruegeria sp. 2205SS24-7]|uniref:GNAT family N-acetyltransferase n=1 Tax=Ruegeria discodermiae TaxID=3064389 RepID=UPI00274284F2|nr:GNAT family N-acetyltransferase [Ruegeria sp. 2205SS24-7]MDP5217604.1 GNAT family N-acetyltransferase [Ruegeria sp. 2205SS24-7]
MIEIRPAYPQDLDAYYRISLRTGHLGRDAGALYEDPKLMGHIHSAPYLLFSRALCVSLLAEGQVAGFCVGTIDTVAFAECLERSWWPSLRASYPMPDITRSDRWTPDEKRIATLHRPKEVPRDIVDRYPAHVHMNLLPECQGRGWGTRLLKKWLRMSRSMGVRAIHLGANPGNDQAIGFWRSQGFEHIPVAGDQRTCWMAQEVSEDEHG